MTPKSVKNETQMRPRWNQHESKMKTRGAQHDPNKMRRWNLDELNMTVILANMQAGFLEDDSKKHSKMKPGRAKDGPKMIQKMKPTWIQADPNMTQEGKLDEPNMAPKGREWNVDEPKKTAEVFKHANQMSPR